MAVYSRLLLSTGGGIISSSQQVEQTPNTATLLIGLGGTGIHCIRTIKTEVYNRLKPDDPDADTPNYEHIRFLGIDSDIYSHRCSDGAVLALDEKEFFHISTQHIFPAVFKTRPEFDWLQYENITVRMNGIGSGGTRQIGRFLMMNRSKEFMDWLEAKIREAKLGLTDPQVNIHIFTGLGGGTGSGCFLDVCYMARHVAERIGGANVLGYFFMPDVNLQNVPPEKNLVGSYILQNGYAALQELDYCMNLPNNGGSFSQVYGGGTVKINWDTPPVDMCHLICATDQNNVVIPDAYDYAMNVVAEYVLDFLIDDRRIMDHLAVFKKMVAEATEKKTIGSNMAYCVIGASSASVPLREINTYLATELFDRFGSIKVNTPTRADVERLVISALAKDAQGITDVYESLYREIRDQADEEYSPYPGTWQEVREYGNSDLVRHYTDTTATKENRLVANAKSMESTGNELSLINRVRSELKSVLYDIDRGPLYAYKMFDTAKAHNLLIIADGMIAENTKRWKHESAQTNLRHEDYDNAKIAFERAGKLANKRKLFNSYEWYLMLLEQHKLAMKVYEKMNELLYTFRDQLKKATAEYYIKLSRVMSTLIDTFHKNKTALAGGRIANSSNSFSIPMMTIAELRGSLDEEIARINIPNMFDAFMRLLVDNEDSWIGEDENKISCLVTKFFVKTAFGSFADRTITRYLTDKYEKKYGELTNAQLADKIYNDWMKLLTERATPLFPLNYSVWHENDTSKFALLKYPDYSVPIREAANMLHRFKPLWNLAGTSAMTNRIEAISVSVGLPLCAYYFLDRYERLYYSCNRSGIHIYEGKSAEGISFTDWRKLPSPYPQSLIDTSEAPHELAVMVEERRALFDEAKMFSLIDDSGKYYSPDLESISSLEQAAAHCIELVQLAETKVQFAHAAEAIINAKQLQIKLLPTDYSLRQDGYRFNSEVNYRIMKDYFVNAPATHSIVKSRIDLIKSSMSKLRSTLESCEEMLAKRRASCL